MSPNLTKNWGQDVAALISKSGSTKDLLIANADMVRRVIGGKGPDKNVADPACGARVAVNIAAVHVAAFCRAPHNGKNYKNTYDLNETPRLEGAGFKVKVPVRLVVDQTLCSVTNSQPEEIYFGAVEVNGSGIRFYGDICFILRVDAMKSDTVILKSNSYDLVRPPITPAGQAPKPDLLKSHVKTMAGRWDDDTPNMAVLKVFALLKVSERRLTTGQISGATLDDEDYLEVLRIGSFDVSNLQEARLSAADAAAEAQVGEQLRLGPCPSLAELQWRKHRRAAVKALQAQGLRSRVITTSGRVRA